jgi:polyisoprenoid-binding protein YceI
MKRTAIVLFVLGVAVAAIQARTQTPPPQQTPPAAAQPQQQQQRPPQPPLGPNEWQIDPAHSAAHFSVRHMMVSTVRGTLGPVSGIVTYDGSTVESVKADVSIDVKGIDTGNSGRDNDLRSPNFFDVANFPTAAFKSKRAEAAGAGKFRLIGDLTIHGVTKEVEFDVEGPAPVVKQQNGMSTGATATTRVNRKDFGLNWNRMIEAGPVVSDDVQVTIDIELRKRTQTAQ